MATLRDAEDAREAYAERLRRLGAHAIIVKQVIRKKKKTFVVLALFDKKVPSDLPKELRLKRQDRSISVELVSRVAPSFHPD